MSLLEWLKSRPSRPMNELYPDWIYGCNYHDKKTELNTTHKFRKGQKMLQRFLIGLYKKHHMTKDDLVNDGWHYAGGLPSRVPHTPAGRRHNATHYAFFLKTRSLCHPDILGWNPDEWGWNVANIHGDTKYYCVCDHLIHNICLITNRDNTKYLYVGFCCVHQLDVYFGEIDSSNTNFRPTCLHCGVKPVKLTSSKFICNDCKRKKCLQCGAINVKLHATTLTCARCCRNFKKHQYQYHPVLCGILNRPLEIAKRQFSTVMNQLITKVRRIDPEYFPTRCKTCAYPISSQYTHCFRCFKKTRTTCHSCGRSIDRKYKFCYACNVGKSRTSTCEPYIMNSRSTYRSFETDIRNGAEFAKYQFEM
jgi:hypothetical protein